MIYVIFFEMSHFGKKKLLHNGSFFLNMLWDSMGTGLFFSMQRIIKIGDFKWLYTKNARLFFSILT
jgi:hypothetical protein